MGAGAEAGAEAAADGSRCSPTRTPGTCSRTSPTSRPRRSSCSSTTGRSRCATRRARRRLPHQRRLHQPARPGRDRPGHCRGGRAAARPRDRRDEPLTPPATHRQGATHVRITQSRTPHRPAHRAPRLTTQIAASRAWFLPLPARCTDRLARGAFKPSTSRTPPQASSWASTTAGRWRLLRRRRGSLHGFLRDRRGAVSTLPEFPGGDPTMGGTQPGAINDRGRIVGLPYDAQGGSRGFQLRGGELTPIDAAPDAMSRVPSTSTIGRMVAATAPGHRPARTPQRGRPIACPVMATFALIHGGGGSAWDWHLVVPELRERGHEPVAVDLPNSRSRPAGGVRRRRDRRGRRARDVIVVGHSLGAFTARSSARASPLTC